jgi:site-specific DNA recombinase
MKNAALYIRVSTTNQAEEGFSIDGQRNLMEKFAESKEYTIFDEYVDGGFTASDTQRPALQRLINDVRNKKIDVVIVYRLDRLSRSQKDTMYLIDDIFLANNVEFISMSESFDTTTPYGRAMVGLLSVFAQLERENIKERVKMGFAERAKQGLYHGGSSIPAGYDFVDGHLVVNETEAFVVRRVFELYASGMSYERIGKYLEQNYKGMYKFSEASVIPMIKNNVFIGKIKYYDKTYDGQHDAIISPKLWESVQARIKRNLKIAKTGKYTFPFTGIIYCAHCGAKMTAMKGPKLKKLNGGQYRYYQCYSKRGTPYYMVKDHNCPAPKTYRAEHIEKYVYDQLKSITIDSFEKMIDQHIQDIEPFQKELDEIDEQLCKLIDLFQIDGIPIDVLKVRTKKLNDKRISLQNTINEIQDKSIKAKERFALNQSEKIEKLQEVDFEESSSEEIRDLIYPLIDRIEVATDDIYIHWNV